MKERKTFQSESSINLSSQVQNFPACVWAELLDSVPKIEVGASHLDHDSEISMEVRRAATRIVYPDGKDNSIVGCKLYTSTDE